MSGNIVKYGGYAEKAADYDSAKIDSVSGNVYLDTPVGTTIVRIVPPPVGKDSPFRITAMHFIDAVPGLDKMIVFACPRVEFKQPCIACQESERLNKSPSPLDRERAYRISAGLRVYANVIDRASPDLDTALKIWSFGKMIYGQLKGIRKNPRLGGDFTDPTEKGFDIIVSREGTGKNDTKYTVAADRNASPLAPTVEDINDIISRQSDLELQVNAVVPEALLNAWAQTNLRGQVSVPTDVGGRTPYAGPPPAAALGPRPGAALMRGRETVTAGADARNPDEVELDDNYEPIAKKK